MRDCPNVEMRERLPDLLHGVLRAEQAAAVRAHVSECADCRAELAMLESVRGALAAPRVDTARIVPKLPTYQRPSLWVRATRSPQLRAAAAVVLLVGGFAFLRLANPSDPRPDSAIAMAPAENEISVGASFQDLTDSDLRAVLDEMTKLQAVTPTSTDDDVPAVIERGGSGGGSSGGEG
jgi:hypothetical protein